jgi:hypothetical protein
VRLRFFFLTAALALAPASALAEPTSWLAVGGGYALERNTVTRSTDTAFALDGAVGVGTPATSPIVVGGVFRATGYVNLGVDMNVSLRIAMQSYAVGDWGLALDLGAGARLWGGGAYGSYPLHGAVILGAPFGFQLTVGVDGWDISQQTPSAIGGFASVGLDFLRLTSMRSGETTKLWANPAPANAPPAPVTP